jgi:hypothetical protein
MNDVSTIDADVDLARKLCRDAASAGGLPEPSALYTLVRFARWTQSVPELVLFVRYQGARRTTPDRLRPFYQHVADAVKGMAGDGIDRCRRFLGFVVRAGAVERERQKRDGQRGGGRR